MNQTRVFLFVLVLAAVVHADDRNDPEPAVKPRPTNELDHGFFWLGSGFVGMPVVGLWDGERADEFKFGDIKPDDTVEPYPNEEPVAPSSNRITVPGHHGSDELIIPIVPVNPFEYMGGSFLDDLQILTPGESKSLFIFQTNDTVYFICESSSRDSIIGLPRPSVTPAVPGHRTAIDPAWYDRRRGGSRLAIEMELRRRLAAGDESAVGEALKHLRRKSPESGPVTGDEPSPYERLLDSEEFGPAMRLFVQLKLAEIRKLLRAGDPNAFAAARKLFDFTSKPYSGRLEDAGGRFRRWLQTHVGAALRRFCQIREAEIRKRIREGDPTAIRDALRHLNWKYSGYSGRLGDEPTTYQRLARSKEFGQAMRLFLHMKLAKIRKRLGAGDASALDEARKLFNFTRTRSSGRLGEDDVWYRWLRKHLGSAVRKFIRIEEKKLRARLEKGDAEAIAPARMLVRFKRKMEARKFRPDQHVGTTREFRKAYRKGFGAPSGQRGRLGFGGEGAAGGQQSEAAPDGQPMPNGEPMPNCPPMPNGQPMPNG